MILKAIIGILVAMSYRLMKCKVYGSCLFTEVNSAIEGVKKQVELCIFDLGQTSYAADKPISVDTSGNGKGCANGTSASDPNSGQGWKMLAATDYATKYVASVSVDANGQITATAEAKGGLTDSTGAGATFIVTPYNAKNSTIDSGIVDWRRENTSTCIAADLC